MLRKSLLAVLLLVFAFSSLAYAQTVDQAASIAQLDAVMNESLKFWQTPGAAVVVIRGDDVIYLKGFGVKDVNAKQPVTPDTVFAIGSTTKAMTAAAFGILVDEGKLGWDDPVTKHLPWFQLRDPVVTREVTVRDLLTHRAGLPNADFLWYGREYSTIEIF